MLSTLYMIFSLYKSLSMLLNDNNNLIKKVTFFYDSKNTNMAGPPSSQSELSWAQSPILTSLRLGTYLWQLILHKMVQPTKGEGKTSVTSSMYCCLPLMTTDSKRLINVIILLFSGVTKSSNSLQRI